MIKVKLARFGPGLRQSTLLFYRTTTYRFTEVQWVDQWWGSAHW